MKIFKIFRNQKGFTLIELLVVIGILAVLLSVTLIAINPARQFAQANNTKRRSDVSGILNAINQYMADKKGVVPPGGIAATDKDISNVAGQADICASLVTQYLAALPVDPKTNNGASITNCAAVGYTTHYHVTQSVADNRITVSAPDAELLEVISVTR